MEILTATEVAAILKISKRQVYELAKQTENPYPKHQDSHVCPLPQERCHSLG